MKKTIPTVRVKNGDGFKTINESAFDPNEHELYDAPAPGKERNLPDEVTRDTIKTMKKSEVVEMLEAHGIEEPKGPVADLRDKLEKVMFVEDIQPAAVQGDDEEDLLG